MSDDTDVVIPTQLIDPSGRAVPPLPDPATRPTAKVEEVAAWLGISRNAAYDAVKRGEIPTIRIGRRILVPMAALHRMLAVEPAA